MQDKQPPQPSTTHPSFVQLGVHVWAHFHFSSLFLLFSPEQESATMQSYRKAIIQIEKTTRGVLVGNCNLIWDQFRGFPYSGKGWDLHIESWSQITLKWYRKDMSESLLCPRGSVVNSPNMIWQILAYNCLLLSKIEVYCECFCKGDSWLSERLTDNRKWFLFTVTETQKNKCCVENNNIIHSYDDSVEKLLPQ